jgi:hypothetical protein
MFTAHHPTPPLHGTLNGTLNGKYSTIRIWHRVLIGLVVAAVTSLSASSALASTTVASTLDQSAGTTAGATHALGLDLKFTNSSGDSPENLTINLPPGLLASASLIDTSNNQRCLQETATTTTAPNSGCQLGTGVVSTTLLDGATPLTIDVGFYLVRPPTAGDLGGLETYSSTLGSSLGTGDILIRPSGDSDGVGATIKLSIPDTVPSSAFEGLGAGLGSLGPESQIQVSEINSSFSGNSSFPGLRYPATCGDQSINGTAETYNDPTVAVPFSSLLTVTGCSQLSYNPQFSASATRDGGDKGVAVTTDLTQTASESPDQSVALAFPTAMFAPNLAALSNLCLNPATGTCSAVGSATAISPLYPSALTGQAYLSGNSSGLQLVLMFPAPFPLTLTGAINLVTNTATFSGLPDIPLTDLKVTLNGGAKALFDATCTVSSGTATAALVGQNGAAKSVSAGISYTGCPTEGGAGSLGGNGSGKGSGKGTTRPAANKLVLLSAKGLRSGKPSLTFTVVVAKSAAPLTRLVVKLPTGLSFRSHKQKVKRVTQRIKRVHEIQQVTGVKLTGAKNKSATLKTGQLVLVLRKGSRKITVRLNSQALKESKALRVKAEKHSLKSLPLKVTVRNTKNQSKVLQAKVTKLNLR